MLSETNNRPKRAVSYIDLPMEPNFARNPVDVLFPVLERHTVVAGRDGVYGGIQMPNNYLLPDKDRDLFLVMGFNAVRQVLTDGSAFSSALGYANAGAKALGKVLFTMDNPEHKKYRALIAQAFNHSTVTKEWLNQHVSPIINEAVAEFSSLGKGDLLQLFTLHFPFRIIAKITGVPYEHADALAEFTQDSLEMGKDPARAMRAMGGMNDIFQSIIVDRRKMPKEDMITALISAELDGEKLSDEDICSFLRNLIAAGLDTTYRATSNLLYYLLNEPGQLDEIQKTPSLLETAIWESLRVDGSGGYVPRVAMKDVMIDEVSVPAGSSLLVCHYIANYDPRIWADPRTFDMRRTRKPILTFGAGPHSCIGNNLAVTEIRMAMETLLEQLPNLRVDPERWDSARIRGFHLRSVDMLPVLWDPR